jgi:hypothetical protein
MDKVGLYSIYRNPNIGIHRGLPFKTLVYTYKCKGASLEI